MKVSKSTPLYILMSTFMVATLAGFFVFPNSLNVYAQYLNSASYQLENPVTIIEGGESASSSFKYLSGSGQLDSGEGTSTSFTNLAGTLYYPVGTTPVLITTAGNSQVALSWTASVGTFGTVTSYSVGISTSSGGVYTYTSVGNVASYTYTGLTNGTTYYFKVRSYALGIALSDSVFVSGTPVGSSTPPPPPPGGGGPPILPGVGGDNGTSSINFSGRAYPQSKVVILKNGSIYVTTIADPLASFSVSANKVSEGEQIFSVYGEDSQGRRSIPFTFPLKVGLDSTINIGGIFLSPTIDVDKNVVKQGENIAIFGQSVPDSNITISVNSPVEFFNNVKTDKEGVYLLNFDTAKLEIGSHSAKSKSAILTEVSPFGNTVAFKVGTESKKKDVKDCSNLRGDLNCDGKVNLVDFSIMAYWYKKSGVPVKIDLNSDSLVNLVDFSILAYNWTG